MPSLFPGAGSAANDPNRQVRYWRPGDGTPGVVRTAFVLYLLCAVGLLVAALLMWTAEPPTSTDADRQATIDAVASVLKWLAVIEAVGAVALCVAVPGLLRGNARARFRTLVVTGVLLVVSLGSWLLGVSGYIQPLIALVLAFATLAAYRPGVRTFFGEPTGDDR
ncbi:hypothetical protein [uncultured Corynebacterium sp.]|uniref:hypothetical protein n=1 Tax=uncultured Corynebacterium sp. TaxID=159447 RepID=UPI0025F511B1|nr:hypothetical protein [uncultured Corynebacterium sp.]